MSNTPIRAAVYAACEPPPDTLIEGPTLRQLVEWAKRITESVEDPSANELKYIEKAWSAVVTDKASVEGVPAGHLSYMLQELQMAEMRLMQQAMADAVGDVS